MASGKNEIAFSILQMVQQRVKCLVHFLLFIRNDHKFECCLTFYYSPVPSCSVSDHPAPSCLLTISKLSEPCWLINTKPFQQQYSEFDDCLKNVKEVRTMTEKQICYRRFCCFFIFNLPDNVLNVCFSVNVPFVLK